MQKNQQAEIAARLSTANAVLFLHSIFRRWSFWPGLTGSTIRVIGGVQDGCMIGAVFERKRRFRSKRCGAYRWATWALDRPVAPA
jgi:hypothetical protein